MSLRDYDRLTPAERAKRKVAFAAWKAGHMLTEEDIARIDEHERKQREALGHTEETAARPRDSEGTENVASSIEKNCEGE